MNLETQEKVSKLIREQADKLGIALKALRKIKKLNPPFHESSEAVDIANNALLEIADHGKDPKDL